MELEKSQTIPPWYIQRERERERDAEEEKNT